MDNMEGLKIGDEVMWRPGFGHDDARLAKVTGIELIAKGEKYGQPVESVDWAIVHSVVVDLDTGHWAYGHQISIPESIICIGCSQTWCECE
jgi:hypothetical protein